MQGRDGTEDLLAVTLANGQWILRPPAHGRGCDAYVHVGKDKLGEHEIEPQHPEEGIRKVADFDAEQVRQQTQPVHE